MWPRDTDSTRLARIDEALTRVSVALSEAHANGELHLVCVLEARYDELLDERNGVPTPRQP